MPVLCIMHAMQQGLGAGPASLLRVGWPRTSHAGRRWGRRAGEAVTAARCLSYQRCVHVLQNEHATARYQRACFLRTAPQLNLLGAAALGMLCARSVQQVSMGHTCVACPRVTRFPGRQ